MRKIIIYSLFLFFFLIETSISKSAYNDKEAKIDFTILVNQDNLAIYKYLNSSYPQLNIKLFNIK